MKTNVSPHTIWAGCLVSGLFATTIGCATDAETTEVDEVLVAAQALSISADELKRIDQYIANHVDPSTVVKSLTRGKSTYDCVEALEQPALRWLRAKTGLPYDHIEAPPKETIDPSISRGSQAGSSAEWNVAAGELEPTPECPVDTVTILRPSREEIASFGSLEAYIHRPPPSELDYEYSVRRYNGSVRGLQARLSLNNPTMGASVTHSISQLWVAGGSGANLETVEAGWIRRTGSKNAELFVFATPDNYTTSCWNTACGFVLYPNSGVTLGNTWSTYSADGGNQYDVQMKIWKTSTSGWIFELDNHQVGYWDSNFFSSDNSGIRTGATNAQAGGEVFGSNGASLPHTTTDMAMGGFGTAGWQHAGFVRNIIHSNAFYVWGATPDNAGANVPGDSNCYNRATADNDANWGNYLYFGGPGRSASCP